MILQAYVSGLSIRNFNPPIFSWWFANGEVGGLQQAIEQNAPCSITICAYGNTLDAISEP
ncbi:MAG: hypothetical protein L3J79_03660 [Candidatus Marinimicrobia bacterium]|nr:hypothetical protein [Candidatus Neomarinimicrobiota bacterium]